MSDSDKITLPKNTGVCVKVSPQELEILRHDCIKANRSAPSLLREKYFNSPPQTILMSHEDVGNLRTEINRIGNCVSHISMEINSGVRHGWNTSFDAIGEQLKTLNKYIVLKYGLR